MGGGEGGGGREGDWGRGANGIVGGRRLSRGLGRGSVGVRPLPRALGRILAPAPMHPHHHRPATPSQVTPHRYQGYYDTMAAFMNNAFGVRVVWGRKLSAAGCVILVATSPRLA
jgi:hypothetical protein